MKFRSHFRLFFILFVLIALLLPMISQAASQSEIIKDEHASQDEALIVINEIMFFQQY